MTGVRRFEAPGKLMLAGEYSVLAPGGLALCLAVAPGLALEATPAERWELARSEGTTWCEGLEVPDALRFAHAAWADAIAELELAPHRLTTSTRSRDAQGKPGLGGSASSVALVTAALHALAGRELGAVREALLPRAIASHRRAQRGRGSGYDVATAVLGGLVSWQRGAARRLDWPGGLAFVAGYSGESASTERMLERLAAIDGRELEVELDALGEPVVAFAAALERAELTALFAAARECQRSLAAWDRARSLGIVTSALVRMIAIAEELGVTAKVSGAGAGDSVVALSDDPDRLVTLARAWRAEGFAPLGLVRDELGVREV